MSALRAVRHDDDAAFATATWDDNGPAGLIIVTFTNVVPTGQPVVPTVVALRSFVADQWDLHLSELRPAFGE